MNSRFAVPTIVLILSLRTGDLEAIENGNELALDIGRAPTPLERTTMIENAIGKLFFFRYLHIKERKDGDLEGRRFIRMRTVEPSSDVHIDFVVRKRQSLKKANPIRKGQGIAVTGRIKTIAVTNAQKIIVLDPVIVRYADRLSPVVEKEMLHEVDPDAPKTAITKESK